MILCQAVPGVNEALKAAERNGYEAILIVVFFITVLGFLVWLIRQWLSDAMNRETRMAHRIDTLEEFIRNDMRKLAESCRVALDSNSQAVNALSMALHERPCLTEKENV